MGRPPCCDKSNVKRGLWTAEEDAKILAYVSRHGTGNWTSVPKKAGLKRCAKSCRLRWTNYLRPDLKQEGFTQEEEELIVKLHETIGSRWSLIAAQLPGRTDNDVKNYWNTKLKKKLKEMGIDHVTHRPFSQVIEDYASIGLSKPAKETHSNYPQNVIALPSTNQDYPGNSIIPGTVPSTPRNPHHSLTPSQDGLYMADHPWDILHQLQSMKLISQKPTEQNPLQSTFESCHTPNEFYKVVGESHQTANTHLDVNQLYELKEYHSVDQLNQTLHESSSSCTTMTSASCPTEQTHVSAHHFEDSSSNWIEILAQDEMRLLDVENISPVDQYRNQSWDFSCEQQMQCMFGSNLVDFTKSETEKSVALMDKVTFPCMELPLDGIQENLVANNLLGSPLEDGFEDDSSSILMWDFPGLLDLEQPVQDLSKEKAPFSLTL